MKISRMNTMKNELYTEIRVYGVNELEVLLSTQEMEFTEWIDFLSNVITVCSALMVLIAPIIAFLVSVMSSSISLDSAAVSTTAATSSKVDPAVAAKSLTAINKDFKTVNSVLDQDGQIIVHVATTVGLIAAGVLFLLLLTSFICRSKRSRIKTKLKVLSLVK